MVNAPEARAILFNVALEAVRLAPAGEQLNVPCPRLSAAPVAVIRVELAFKVPALSVKALVIVGLSAKLTVDPDVLTVRP